MPRCCRGFLLCLGLFLETQRLDPQAVPAIDAGALVNKIQAELTAPFPPMEGKVDTGVPHGELLHSALYDSKIFPGTENEFDVYVPAQYDPQQPACLLVKLDGLGQYEATVLDNLIARHEVPVMIGVGIHSGVIWKNGQRVMGDGALRFNRSYEFDSVNDHFPDYVLNELLPAVQKMATRDGRPIRISPKAEDHMATGGSTGGIGAFTLAWRRPDQFARVYSVIGTFVSMRGGHDYPALIRKTDPKAIRIFLEDGSEDAWNPLFGSWYEANLNMEGALRFAGYDVAHAWGKHGHDGKPGEVILPDVLRWLWRDYPKPIQAGVSQNSTLQEVTLPGEGWQNVPEQFQSVAGLAADQNGEVFASDPATRVIYRMNGEDGPAKTFYSGHGAITGEAFGPDGVLYGLVPNEKRVIAVGAGGRVRTVVRGIAGHSIVVTHDGVLYVSEPGLHSEMPSRVWRISKGQKRMVDQGLLSASGVALSPDGSLLFAAEKSTQWIYSYVVGQDGSVKNKQPFYWLHMTDIPNNSGAEDLAVDTHGNLYVATGMGIQICDQNGRVRAILALPTPSGPVRSLCFGGKNFDVLYATDGKRIFRRRLKVTGFAPWAAPMSVASQGAG